MDGAQVIKISEHLMGRDKTYPLTMEMWINLAQLIAGVNYLRGVYGKPLSVSSGYRPGVFNRSAGGAKNSAHMTCEAIDVVDTDGDFAAWCLDNLDELEKAGLYMEDPNHTPGWVHLQTREPRSGKRVFLP
jgi:hypothetical protein